jgi:CubicO group peptidase (beta-lactamase class C family)
LSTYGYAGERVPADQWLQYKNPADAGFDTEKLSAVHEAWTNLPSSAFMVVADGAVVAAWGDIDRRYMCHSVRKSFLSALFGIYWDKGEIELNKTLQDLGINDIRDGLLETERQARILDLLKARSGVFHPAAYAGRTDSRPRGSEGPGRYWAYNNWDFNTLVTIFEQESGQKIFPAFDEHFARPLGMEDWRISDGYYHYEPEKSEHPAYPFRISAKDAARFGLLFARDGRWGDTQILSRHWVHRSSAMYSIDSEVFGYGFMWWVARDPQLEANGFFAARGVGNQMIVAMPDSDLVVVNRANTYEREDTPTPELIALIKQLLDARTLAPNVQPDLVPLPNTGQPPYVTHVPDSKLQLFKGTFAFPPAALEMESIGSLEISVQDGHLQTFSPQQGSFIHYLQPDGSFIEEDSLQRYIPVYDKTGNFSGLSDDSMLIRAGFRALATNEPVKSEAYFSQVRTFGGLNMDIASMVLLLIEDFEAGEQRARDLVQSESEFTIARTTSTYGHDLLDAGRPDLAEVLFTLNTRLSPQISRVWEDLGDVQKANGEAEKALQSYQKSLEISPERERTLQRIEALTSSGE